MRSAIQNAGNAGREMVNRIPAQFLTNIDSEYGNVVDREAMYRYLVENDLLRRDEAREIEESVTAVADRDYMGLSDLRTAGLVKPLRDIGVTMVQVDRESAVPDGQQSMSILSLGDRDQITYTPTIYPVPVTTSQFQLDRRMIAAGRNMGQGVDRANVEAHTRACVRRLEDTLFNGNSDIVISADSTQYSLKGYTNLTARQQVSLEGSNWDDMTSGARSDAVLDVINMKKALAEDGYPGPYVLYIPSNWEGTLDDDYKANTDRTLRERILAISGVQDVKVHPSLSDDEAVMVELTRNSVEYAVAQELTPLTYDIKGGLAMNWVVMEVSTNLVKTAEDEDGTATSGVAHLS